MKGIDGRRYLRECDAQSIRDQLGTGAANIAQLVPEIRGWLPELPPLPHINPEQRRVRLFDAVTRFLETSRSTNPC